MGRLVAFASVLGLAAAGGGWSAVSWGWGALALCWAAALALVLRPRRPSRLELAFVGGLLLVAAWTGASTLWSQSVPASVLEVERAVVYVAGAAAAVLLFRAGAEDGVLAAAVVVCAWNLVTRIAGYDPHVLGADAQPIGYANGLGLLAAIGCILALRRPWTLPALAVCLPALVLARSTGSWLALAAGVVVAARPRLAPVVAVVAAVAVAVGLHGPRTDYWSVALADARAHPALGSGAGTYRQVWIERRPTRHETRDAHSLYLETLAELGPLGLVLVAGTLALPFLAGGGAALGAYAAFVVQAGIDWEWELPAVTLAGLFSGIAALRAGRGERLLGRGPAERPLGRVRAEQLLGRVRAEHFLGRNRPRPGSPRSPGDSLPSNSLLLDGHRRTGDSVPSNSLLLGTGSRRTRVPPLPRAVALVPRAVPLVPRAVALAGILVVAVFAAVGLLGNRAIDRAAEALRVHDPAAAADARAARRWAPWSAEPYRIEAQARGGDPVLLRAAIVRDPHDWSLWAALAAATSGPERERAAAMAARLDPRYSAPSG